MDYSALIDYHRAKGADVTIAATPADAAHAAHSGILMVRVAAAAGVAFFYWCSRRPARGSGRSTPAAAFFKAHARAHIHARTLHRHSNQSTNQTSPPPPPSST